MKKAGIITLNGENNYGNRLQNFALQRAITKLGHTSETIILEDKQSKLLSFIKGAAVNILPVSHRRLDYWKMLKSKKLVFQPFSQEFIKSTRVTKGSETEISSNYSLFITGSDQVWNPSYVKNSDTNFLSFAPIQKRFSYAASFGVSEIPDDKKDFYRKKLEGMHMISVREQAGVDIVRDLTGRKAELVPDPTLLLTKEEWEDTISGYSHLKEKKYVVVYTLHELDAELSQSVNDFADKHGTEIYRIMGDFYDPMHAIPNPAEFVARIKYAQAVYTDSFHASVFSIIMHTPFKVLERKDMKMSSRLHTLLSTYGVEIALGASKISSSQYDFLKSDKIAEKERAHGVSYLSKIISESKKD